MNLPNDEDILKRIDGETELANAMHFTATLVLDANSVTFLIALVQLALKSPITQGSEGAMAVGRGVVEGLTQSLRAAKLDALVAAAERGNK